MSEQKRVLTLDLSKWRSGGNRLTLYRTGEGATQMKNELGYMCCLGQFASQCGVPDQYLIGAQNPRTVASNLNKVYDKLFLREREDGQPRHTPLAEELIAINDCSARGTYPQDRVELIRAKLAEHDVELEVVGSL